MYRTSLLLVVLTAGLANADTIADWTFEANSFTATNSATFNGAVADVGTGTAGGSNANASFQTNWSSPVGNGSAHSLSVGDWTVGDYFEFDFNTTGYSNLALNFEQTGSTSAPASFKIETSLNGTSWSDLASGAYTSLRNGASPNATWNASTYGAGYQFGSYTLPDGTVGVRLVDTSTVAEGTGTVNSGGISRIDNFLVSGDLSNPSAPEPGTAGLALLVLAALSAIVYRKRRRQS